ncbi:MAG TPA: RodZ domain-containing protein [Acetobacteraceae bacterium]|nr:RodZ domain-containing protein [Acetobacteraceae bacterium]
MTQMDGNGDIGFSLDLDGPARVGAELRDVRERLGWSLEAIAVRLKIKLDFLQAIEAGDLAALPAPAYAAGFIRSYADALGLDPEEILRRFRAGGMTRAKRPTLAFPEPVPERGVPPGAIALLVAVIAIGLYVVWYRHSEHKLRMAETIPPVPAKLAPLAVPKPPAPPRTAPAAGVATKPAPEQLHAAPRAPEAPTRTAMAVNPPSEAAASIPLPPPEVTPPADATGAAAVPASTSPSGNAPAGASAAPAMGTAIAVAPLPVPPEATPAESNPAPSSPAVAPPGANSSPAPAAAASPALAVAATARTWVEIRDIKGKILFSRVMEPGQSWPLPDEPGLTLTTGNAGGTQLVRNGAPGPALGPSGAVIHNALITPGGSIVPPPPPPSPVPRSHLRHSFLAPSSLPPPRPYRHVRRHHAKPRASEPTNPFAIPTSGD